MKRIVCLLISILLMFSLVACDETNTKETKETYFKISDFTEEDRENAKSSATQYYSHFNGYVGNRVASNIKNWLYSAYESNPLMLDSIRQKDLTNIADNVQFWFGMYAPCVLRAAAGSYKMEHDRQLYDSMEKLIEDSILCIQTYGSLEYDNGEEFPLINPSWLNGAMAWYNASKSEKSLELGKLIGDYYITTALERGINDTMPIIGLAQLCIATHEEKYDDLLDQYILATGWTGGDYYNAAGNSEYCQMVRHNWENVFEVEALGYMGDYFEDESYYDALRYMYESIILTDRRSTGANTTGESALGTPYGQGSAETCAIVTWLECMSKLAQVQKKSDVIDELEMGFWNATLGAQDVNGRWWTYDTPQEGYKVASINELSWQIAQGAPEFSCCMSNCGVGLSTLAEWALTRDENGIYVNYYGDSEFASVTPLGNWILLTQDTKYPSNGNIKLTLTLEKDEKFTLALRIPVWSENSSVKVNGTVLETPNAGGYYSITNEWKNGDEIEISLDMSLHYWAQDDNLSGLCSVYYGPVLLTLDKRFNSDWDGNQKWLNLTAMNLTVEKCETYPETAVLVKITDAEKNELVLCDFATAGQSGTYYTSWFKQKQLSTQTLTRNVCCWNQRYISKN